MSTATDEALLATVLPKADQALASRLVQDHGGLAGLRRLPPPALMALGVSKPGAERICAALELGTRAVQASVPRRASLHEPDHIAQVHADMGALAFEEVRVLCLNTKSQLIASHTVAKGGVAGCQVEVRAVFYPAIQHAAAAIALVHNHPSGDVVASEADLHLTRIIIEAGRLLDIPVVEHLIIVQGGSWWSMRTLNRGLAWQ